MEATTKSKDTHFDPVRILGCTPSEVRELLRGRRVTPGEVEGAAMRTYNWRQHLRDPHSYWVTVSQAAEILGTTMWEVRRLLRHDGVWYGVHRTGVRLMRRRDIEELAGHLRLPRQRGSERRRSLLDRKPDPRNS